MGRDTRCNRFIRLSPWQWLTPIALAFLSGCATNGAEPAVPEIASAEPTVEKIQFSGNEAFSGFALRGAMETKQRSKLTFWKPGSPYQSDVLEDDLFRLRKYYFDRGFLDTQATLDDVAENDDGETVSIYIGIDEGVQTQVDSVGIAGQKPPELPTEDVLIEDLALRVGKPLNKERFDESVGTLQEYLEDAGYARASVKPDTQVDGATSSAQVQFELIPQDRTRFGAITVTGAEQIPEYVVRREISFEQGEIYSAKEIRDSQRRIFELNMFSAVTPSRLNLAAAEEPLDIQFDVRERKPRSFELGIGLSSVENMRYEADWTHRNLFGEGETLNLLARVTGINQGLEADFVEPYFFNRDTYARYTLFLLNFKQISTDPFGIVESVFKIEDPYPAYDFFTAGAEWQVHHDFTKQLEGVAGLEFASTDFYNIDSSADEELLDGVEDNKLFIQFVELEWNGRDSDLKPRKGVLLRGKLDHSNNKLISDASYAKVELEGRYYVPLFDDTTLAMRLLVGGIEPYGGTDVIPVNERFYAGGPGSVRGYLINRLGPLDSNDNPVGGNSLIEGSAELRFPIAGPIGGSVFVDFGNVYLPSWTYDLADLKYSVGAGVYYMTPIGPLRFEVAAAINPENNDITTPWIFGIGHAF